MKNSKLILSVAFLTSMKLFAQDVHFSQSSEAPLLLNPSQAGLGHDVLVNLNYKSQWKSVTVPYNTINAGADFTVFGEANKRHMGIGLNVFSDKAGDGSMSSTFGTLDLSGVLRASGNNLISGGFGCGFGQRSVVDNFTWDNQFDGVNYNSGLPTLEPGATSNFNLIDLSAGISWYYGDQSSTISSNNARIFTVGFAVQHLNTPQYSYYGNADQKLPMEFIAHGKGNFGLKNYSLILEPSYLVMIQAGHHEITPGLMVKYTPKEASHYTGRIKASAFCLGGYYRTKDAFVACVRYEFSNWAAGFSYDLNISDLKTESHAKGGFEIALRFMTPDPFARKTSRRMMD
ncbi:hypothetical protein BH09BAC5_BH09BAC5_06640 [soil metagenome]